jgi:hypothetical protein
MNTKQKDQPSFPVSHERLLEFVQAMISVPIVTFGGDDWEGPGPLDVVIRRAVHITLEQARKHGTQAVHHFPWDDPISIPIPSFPSGPSPDPWRIIFASLVRSHPEIWDAISGGQNYGTEAALNPQPLPPRFIFLVSLAQSVVSRAELMQEIADTTIREDQQQNVFMIGRYIDRIVDEFCGNNFKIRWPFPSPRPNWFPKEVNGIDLVVMAAQFERGAKEAFSEELQRHLRGASRKLAEAGLSKMHA